MEIRDHRFLITGGISLIGSHITDRLLALGAREVVLFDNFALGSEASVQPLLRDARVKFVRGDILRSSQLMDAMRGIDGVFAVAGFLTLPLNKDPQLGVDVNVRGHQNVLDACRWNAVKKVVFSSSTAVYGTPVNAVVRENDPFNTQGLQAGVATYGATKVIGEQLLRMYSERYGIDYIALRYSTVYGERQHYRGINALYIIETYDRIRKGLAPVLPGNGQEVHDYIYVGDVARANAMAMESQLTGEAFTIASGVETTLNELVAIILDLAGSSLRPEYRDDPTKFRATTTEQLSFSHEKAERLLGWTPEVDVREGVRRLMAWHDSAQR